MYLDRNECKTFISSFKRAFNINLPVAATYSRKLDTLKTLLAAPPERLAIC